jgi:hypothetical protein
MDNKRCEQCGRRLPCQPCDDLGARASEEAVLDALQEEPPRSSVLLVWFTSPLARQHLNRLTAEWPGAIEVIEPTEPGDWLGCRIARTAQELEGTPVAEYEVDHRSIRRADAYDDPFFQALRGLMEREISLL